LNYSLKEIADAVNGKLISRVCVCCSILGVSINSREIKPGDCFVAIKGEKFNGHDYLDSAFDAGANCAIVSTFVGENVPDGKCVILVDDTTEALGKLAAFHRNNLSAKVIAITGSVGKTTTRDLLHHIVREKFNCHCAIKSFNNEIGLPLTILGADEKTELLITEIGTNHPGEISSLSKIAAPNIAIITKIAPAHLHGFGTLENIVKEKCSITHGLRPLATLIVNGQNEITDYLNENKIDHISYHHDSKKTAIEIDGKAVEVDLPGNGYRENAQGAWCVCKELGICAEYFLEKLRSFKTGNMRMEIFETPKLKIINDCYNANPCSMENALNYLSSLKSDRRKVFIAGDMAELGEMSQILHQELGKQIANSDTKLLLCVGDFSETIAKTASYGNSLIETHAFKDTESLRNKLHDFVKADDIILIKASRSVGLEKALETIYRIFS